MPGFSITCPELRKIAYDELNEVDSRIPKDIEQLRDWIEKQPHINARTDDRFLLAFLRDSKYSLEKAKMNFDYFCTIRSMLPEIFGNNSIDEQTLALCRAGVYLQLPKPLGGAGPRIHLTIGGNLDFDRYNLTDVLRFERMLVETSVFDDDNYTISGYIEIYDAEHVNIKTIANFDLILLKRMSVFAEKAAPISLKAVHIVNCPKEAYTLLKFIKSLMSKKMQNRLYVHKTLDDLYEKIPRIYLPIEYGGENGSIAEISAESEKLLTSYDFTKHGVFTIDETKRPPGKDIDQQTIFGIEGSFRTLSVD